MTTKNTKGIQARKLQKEHVNLEWGQHNEKTLKLVSIMNQYASNQLSAQF